MRIITPVSVEFQLERVAVYFRDRIDGRTSDRAGASGIENAR